MKSIVATVFLIVVGLSLVTAGCSTSTPAPQGTPAPAPQGTPVQQQQAGSAAGRVIELSFVSEYMESHPTVVNAFKPWFKSIEEKTGGRVKISFYNPNTLVPAKEVYAAVVGGTADIGASAPQYTPGKFPLAEVMELPFMYPGAEAGSLTTWDLYQKYPEWRAETKDTKLLWHWASATFQLHTTKKQVKTLDDLKGMKIIAWNPKGIQMLRLLGANPVEVAAPDTYLALERGMAEGVLCPLAPLRSFKITEVAKYHTIINIGGNSFYAVMNTEKWKSLGADVQKIFEETTGRAMAQACGKSLDEGAVADSKWMKDNGHTFYVLPEAEKAKWAQATAPIVEAWIKETEGKGIKTAKQIHDDASRLAAEYGKTTGRGYYAE